MNILEYLGAKTITVLSYASSAADFATERDLLRWWTRSTMDFSRKIVVDLCRGFGWVL